jgi:hypothetical protein
MLKVLDPNQTYTFSKIFELKAYTEDVISDFGYEFVRGHLVFPHFPGDISIYEQTPRKIQSILPFIDLVNEVTRREMIISPVISDLIEATQARVRIEFPIQVNSQLQGFLDYYLVSQSEVIIIEAKQEDLYNGFTQLATELIALDQWDRTPNQSTLVGAVTTGLIWQFGRLQRETKQIEQDLNIYRLLEDWDPLLRILIQALLG